MSSPVILSLMISHPEGIISVSAMLWIPSEMFGFETLMTAVNSVPCLMEVGEIAEPSAPIYLTFRAIPVALAGIEAIGSACETTVILT